MLGYPNGPSKIKSFFTSHQVLSIFLLIVLVTDNSKRFLFYNFHVNAPSAKMPIPIKLS